MRYTEKKPIMSRSLTVTIKPSLKEENHTNVKYHAVETKEDKRKLNTEKRLPKKLKSIQTSELAPISFKQRSLNPKQSVLISK